MIAVHLEAGRVEIREMPIPKRPPGFALIRLLMAGICNTDLELQRGYYDFSGTPGHEFVGEVVAADSAALLGKRVVGEINIGCRQWDCGWCVDRIERHCPDRTVLGIVRHPGAFSEFFTLPERNLHIVPESIPTELAVFTEPLAAARHILDQCDIDRGIGVAVLGDGKLGLLIAQVLHAHGCIVHLYGRHPEKMRLVEKKRIVAHANSWLRPASYQWIVEATGSPEGLRSAITMVEPKGVIVMKSTVHGEVALDTAAVIVNEIKLVGSRCGRFEPALELLEQKKVKVRPMISATMPLVDAPRAFEKAGQNGVLKVLLTNAERRG